MIYYERYVVINPGVAEGVEKMQLLSEEEYFDVGRSNGHSLQNHPFRTVALARGTESLDYLEALERLGLALLRAFLVGLVTEAASPLPTSTTSTVA